MNVPGPAIAKVETHLWAEPAEGVSLDALVAQMAALGNDVLAVDREHNRLLVGHRVEEF